MLQSMGFTKSQKRLAEQQQNIWQIHLIRVIQGSPPEDGPAT